MGLLYLIPKHSSLPDGLLDSLALADRFENGHQWRACLVGVTDGQLRAWQGAASEADAVIVSCDAVPGFYPDQQTWQRAEHKGQEYWVGYENAKRPGPAELTRRQMMAGHYVQLADGQRWLIPVARSFGEGTALPQTLIMGADGKLIYDLKDSYRGLFDRASQIAAEVYKPREELPEQGIPIAISPEEKFLLAADALAVNYRVGVAEVNLLRLFDTSSLVAVLEALVDLPAFIELVKQMAAEKKKRADE